MTEIIAGFGIENLNLGMSIEQIVNNWGEPEEISSYDDETIYYVWYQKGICCCFSKEHLIEGIFFYTGLPGGFIENGNFPYKAFKTNIQNGISMESTEFEIRSILGKPTAEGVIDFAEIPYIWLSYNGLGFDIVMDSKKIFCISVGKFQ